MIKKKKKNNCNNVHTISILHTKLIVQLQNKFVWVQTWHLLLVTTLIYTYILLTECGTCCEWPLHWLHINENKKLNFYLLNFRTPPHTHNLRELIIDAYKHLKAANFLFLFLIIKITCITFTEMCYTTTASLNFVHFTVQ